MAKQKTKRIPFDTTATEVRPNVWQWEQAGFTWQWTKGLGLNFGTVNSAGDYQPQCFINTIDQAGIFTEGFRAGLNHKGAF